MKRLPMIIKVSASVALLTLSLSGKKKVAFESWSFQQGCYAIVAAPAEVVENTGMDAYAGYKAGGGHAVHLGPVPATYEYRVADEKGNWGHLTSANAPQATYKLTSWSDNNYAGEWDRRIEGKRIILTGGANPPAAKSVWYKFDYSTERIMTDYTHTQDQKVSTPIQSHSATPRVWKVETYLDVPPQGTVPGTVRCMPRSFGSHLYKVVQCVLTNISGTNSLAWALKYDLPKD
ncbi:MAG: hypothetical protein N2595_03340 [bacterium]|nr:hypothetical protein [bacterium]